MSHLVYLQAEMSRAGLDPQGLREKIARAENNKKCTAFQDEASQQRHADQIYALRRALIDAEWLWALAMHKVGPEDI